MRTKLMRAIFTEVLKKTAKSHLRQKILKILYEKDHLTFYLSWTKIVEPKCGAFWYYSVSILFSSYKLWFIYEINW